MKKALLLFYIFSACSLFAQNPSLLQKLYYTCKVWGFAKYYHSAVSNCQVNWDSVLLANLPAIKNAGTKNEFNDVLNSMLVAAGPMALSTSYFPDTLAPELKRNRNWSWINDTLLRSDVQTVLDTIKNNFRPHAGCYVALNTSSMSVPGANGGFLLFPGDSILLNTNTYTNYPDEFHRLLLLYKFWNIINYFNPYDYVLDKPTDSILNDIVLNIDTAASPNSLYNSIKKITGQLNSVHVEQLSYSTAITYPDEYDVKLGLKYIQGKYVVVKSGVAAIQVGDQILSVDGLTTTQWEDSLRPYISAGNVSVFHRFMCDYLFWGHSATSAAIVYADTSGNTGNAIVPRNMLFGDAWYPQYYFPADSLSSIKHTILGCGLGYIDPGNMSSATNADLAYAALQNTPVIIIDLRKYPYTYASNELLDQMIGTPINYEKVSVPDATYPGTFSWNYFTPPVSGTATPYPGTVILLMNESTQSAAENTCMAFGTMPNVIKIGSQTAGADGVVTYFQLSQDIHSGFTSTGIYYPNGDSTERIGIVPDIIVSPTVAGIMAGRDEVLDKAIQVACSLSSVQPLTHQATINIFPNPTTDIVNIDAQNLNSNRASLSLTDVTGKALLQKELKTSSGNLNTSIDIRSFAPGLYILTVNGGAEEKLIKLIKQ